MQNPFRAQYFLARPHSRPGGRSRCGCGSQLHQVPAYALTTAQVAACASTLARDRCDAASVSVLQRPCGNSADLAQQSVFRKVVTPRPAKEALRFRQAVQQTRGSDACLVVWPGIPAQQSVFRKVVTPRPAKEALRFRQAVQQTRGSDACLVVWPGIPFP